jgi:uncharacterized glyoxalase superfamily protein PhnB
MPNILSITAVLPAANVAESLAWWVNVCGFVETFRMDDVPTYAGIKRGGAELHLGIVRGAELVKAVAEQTVTRIQVDDVDAMHAEYLGRGGKVHPNGALATKPWGTREFATIDPAGVLVWFTQRL